MFTDALASDVSTKKTVVLPGTCRCGAKMATPQQAPSYCGDYFYTKCEKYVWYNDKHDYVDYNGHISNFDVVIKD